MVFFSFLFMIVWFTVAFFVIKTVVGQAAEKSSYRKMIANPCDETVIEYIPKFNATCGGFNTLVNIDKALSHKNNLARQAQGWVFISECETVSDDVKKQLKTAYLSGGVSVI